MKKIAILTLPFDTNYGWILQLWALYHILCTKGYDVTILNRKWNEKKPSLLKNCLRFVYYNSFAYTFAKFMQTKMEISPVFRTTAELCEYVKEKRFDVVIVGSDQVWRIEHTRGADLNYFLDFVNVENTKRIAYAASFGTDIWQGTEKETALVNKYLSDFTLVSVREDSGVSLCKNTFGLLAHHVLDPTMLLTEKDYSALFRKHACNNNSIATYILNSSEWKESVIKKIQEMYHLDKVVSLYPHKHSRYHFYSSISHWLSSIESSKYVIIDSFHGMVFSVLFHRQFVVIANPRRGLTRFTSFLKQLNLSNRMVTEGEEVESVLEKLNKPINYKEVDSILTNLRKYSLELLLKSIEE